MRVKNSLENILVHFNCFVYVSKSEVIFLFLKIRLSTVAEVELERRFTDWFSAVTS